MTKEDDYICNDIALFLTLANEPYRPHTLSDSQLKSAFSLRTAPNVQVANGQHNKLKNV